MAVYYFILITHLFIQILTGYYVLNFFLTILKIAMDILVHDSFHKFLAVSDKFLRVELLCQRT